MAKRISVRSAMAEAEQFGKMELRFLQAKVTQRALDCWCTNACHKAKV